MPEIERTCTVPQMSTKRMRDENIQSQNKYADVKISEYIYLRYVFGASAYPSK